MKLLAIAPFVAAAAAFGAHNEPPKGEVTKTDNFTWADPFHDHRLTNKLAAACTAERTFTAREYQLHDLYEHDPKGLWAYGDALKKIFAGRPYPGGWDGLDPHMYDRPLLLMPYSDVPVAVREWIERESRRTVEEETEEGVAGQKETEGDKKQNTRKHLFAVFERPTEPDVKVIKTVTPAKTAEKAAMLRPLDAKRVVIFAPGALYTVLPLWVAEGSECKTPLLDLKHYSAKPKDGGVIAWTTAHTPPNRSKDEREMTFTIKAQTLQAAGAATVGGDGGKEHVESDKDEL